MHSSLSSNTSAASIDHIFQLKLKHLTCTTMMQQPLDDDNSIALEAWNYCKCPLFDNNKGYVVPGWPERTTDLDGPNNQLIEQSNNRTINQKNGNTMSLWELRHHR